MTFHQCPTFAFALEIEYNSALLKRIAHSGTHCHKGALFRVVAALLGCVILSLLLRFALKGSSQAVAETAENTYPPRTVRI